MLSDRLSLTSICSPAIRHNSSPWHDELLDDGKKGRGVSLIHWNKKAATRSALDTAEEPLLIGDESSIVFALANHRFVDFHNHTMSAKLDGMCLVVVEHILKSNE